MQIRVFFVIYLIVFFTDFGSLLAQTAEKKNDYHNPSEIISLLQQWGKNYPQITKIITIGTSIGGNDLDIFRIASETNNTIDPEYRPAVFVCANIEGVHLVGTEAALNLIDKLLVGYETDQRIMDLINQKTVYVMPLMNPDAAANFLKPPYYLRYSNNKQMDDDFDGKIDEDRPDDLNKDGLITKMRVKDPNGLWTIDSNEPRLMQKKQSESKNRQTYSIYLEGRDDDHDGFFNEDPPGGIELSRNFPFSFEYNLPKANIWPDSTNETAALITFLIGHPNISLILNFSLENIFLDCPGIDQVVAENQTVTLPGNLLVFLGLQPQKDYSLRELNEIFLKSSLTAHRSNRNENAIASYLGLSPIDFFDPLDQPFFSAIQRIYKNEMKDADLGFSIPRINGIVKGSFLNFCYFHLGAPVFSSNLYAIPTTQQIQIPDTCNPDSYFLKWSDQLLNGEGFVNWQPFKHPDLGQVEIGGFNPLLIYNPPLNLLEKSVSFHNEFYIKLMTHLADLQIKQTNVKKLNEDLYKVTVHFVNQGWFPTATAYGRKKLSSPPIIVRLKTTKEQMIYTGQPFEVIDVMGENGQIKILKWTIKGKRGSKVILKAESPKIGQLETEIELK